MSYKIGDVVLPGDVIMDVQSNKGVIILGPGLRRSEDSKGLIATKGGVLTYKPNNVYWVDNNQKRYIPKKGDLVVGIVAKKSGDIFKIDIGSCEHASLSSFAFEGATKKQKPDLQVGDVIYAKLLSAYREMEPELVCVDKYFKAANLGPLSNDGFIINIHPNITQRLLNVNNPVVQTLGRKYTYEIAIGMNGKIWVNSKSVKNTLTIVRALYSLQNIDDNSLIEVCKRF